MAGVQDGVAFVDHHPVQQTSASLLQQEPTKSFGRCGFGSY